MSHRQSDLEQIYAQSDDPWNFAHSSYEQEKFRATRAALGERNFNAALELGCGNGQLARHISPLCKTYTGLDAVQRPLEAARRAVPAAQFVQGFLPEDLPEGDFDLIVLSEVLYFLSAGAIRTLAARIAERWPVAFIVCVSYLGPTQNTLEGAEALEIFITAMGPSHEFHKYCATRDYRIDRGIAKDQS